MNKTTKATLWILGVFAALTLAVYFAGCGGDDAADTGVIAPAACAKAGDKCEGGICLEETGSKFSCFAECTVVGDTCKLVDASDGTCYLYGTKDQFACMATGSKAVGETCGTMSDCAAGLQCLEMEGVKNCWLVCADTCDTGDCTDTELGFKVCVAAAAE